MRKNKIEKTEYRWGMDYKDALILKNKLFQTYNTIKRLRREVFKRERIK